jgi:hypothetical protein
MQQKFLGQLFLGGGFGAGRYREEFPSDVHLGDSQGATCNRPVAVHQARAVFRSLPV